MALQKESPRGNLLTQGKLWATMIQKTLWSGGSYQDFAHLLDGDAAVCKKELRLIFEDETGAEHVRPWRLIKVANIPLEKVACQVKVSCRLLVNVRPFMLQRRDAEGRGKGFRHTESVTSAS